MKMPELEKNKQDQKKTPEQSPRELELLEQLKQKDLLLQQLEKDENVRLAVKASMDGKKVVFQDESKESKEKDPPSLTSKKKEDIFDPDKINNMANSDLVSLLLESVEEYVGSSQQAAIKEVSGVLDKKFTEFGTKQQRMEQFLVEQAKNTGLMHMKEKFSDFEYYKEDVIEIMNKQGLSYEDAYILAKGRKSKGAPPPNSFESERPGAMPGRDPLDLSRRASDEDGQERQGPMRGDVHRRLKDIVERKTAERFGV
jgi:hypothetical protein